MVRSHCAGRLASLVALLCLVVIMMPRTTLGAASSSCKAANHHCPDTPSLTCCCGGETAVFEAAAIPVTKNSHTRSHQPYTYGVFAVDAEAGQAPRLRPWTPSHFNLSPPLDRSVLFAALLL